MDINRKTAYNTLLEMEKTNAFSNIELNHQISRLNPDNPSFVRELVYGVTENRIYIDYILSKLITKNFRKTKKPVLTMLRMGIYQIIFMDSVPEYAAVSETVKMTKKFTPGMSGFVNGVLRGYLKKKDQIKLPDRNSDFINYLSVRYSFDPWICSLWTEQFGKDRAEKIIASSNNTPEVSVRTNILRTTRNELCARLEDEGFEVKKGSLSSFALFVTGSGLLDSELYREGLFSIQDEASMLACESLDPKNGEDIIDICAAPGGKTLAIAEYMGNAGRVRAFDYYEHKLSLLENESSRLGINIIETGCNDATVYREDLADSADRVLADVPCSGLGVIRRKPEIKFKAIEDSCRSLAEKQYAILENASKYVKKGGILVYSTCTINKIENSDVTERFLKANSGFDIIDSRQFITGEDETDGFYICKMKRKN